MVPLIVNPDAGAGRAKARALALRPRLEAAFGGLDWQESRSAEHLTEFVAAAARAGHPCVLVAGGDGTAHFAAQGLLGTETALGILPVGTGNDIAYSVGVPEDLDAAVDVLAAGHVRAIDVGEANGRAYCCVLGVGMDTPALERINSARFLRRGHLLYTLAALRTLLTYRAPRVGIEWGEGTAQRWEGELVFAAVTNTRSYAGGMKITPLAEVEDGALDLCLIPRLGLPRLLASFGRVLDGRHVGMKGIVLAQSPLVRITSDRALPVTLDGELTDLTTPIEVRVLPAALRLLAAQRGACAAPQAPRGGAPVASALPARREELATA